MAMPFGNIVHSRFAKTAVIVSTIAVSSLFLANSASAVQSRIDLGTASTFAVLAGQGITNSGTTTADGPAGGDFGSEPNPAFTGIADVTTDGTKFSAVVPQIELAQDDSTAAYLDAASRTPFTAVTDLAGLTLVPGV